MRKSNEAIWWALFAAGGMIAALVVPLLMIITGFVIPFDLAGDEPFAHERIHGAVSHPAIKFMLFALVALPLFHWAHRFSYLLVDMGLQRARSAISVLCYGSAIVGTILTALVLWRF